MARMALGEALTNLLWAAASGLADVKASVNWMCAAPHLFLTPVSRIFASSVQLEAPALN
jgi:phosphoribosylformylglycinamidine (FGAM) synthase-like enzyme